MTQDQIKQALPQWHGDESAQRKRFLKSEEAAWQQTSVLTGATSWLISSEVRQRRLTRSLSSSNDLGQVEA